MTRAPRPVDVLRRFNRTYTQRIGVLEESFLSTGRPLAASRLLFEIGGATSSGAPVSVGALRARLGLDDGYLARLLRRLERDGLLTSSADPVDRRRRLLELTPAGDAALADLEQRSEERAAALLGPLTDAQAARLADALATADLLVRAATVDLREVPADDPDACAAVARYVAELTERFDGGFVAPPAEPADAGGLSLLATSDGEAVAHGALRSLGERTAEVKRLWVDPSWRGAGLGARVLRELEERARDDGQVRVVLDTHADLTEAVALYGRAGYRTVERYNDNPYAQAFFAKDLR